MIFKQHTLMQIRSLNVCSLYKIQKSALRAPNPVFRPELDLERQIRYETDQSMLLQTSQILFPKI